MAKLGIQPLEWTSGGWPVAARSRLSEIRSWPTTLLQRVASAALGQSVFRVSFCRRGTGAPRASLIFSAASTSELLSCCNWPAWMPRLCVFTISRNWSITVFVYQAAWLNRDLRRFAITIVAPAAVQRAMVAGSGTGDSEPTNCAPSWVPEVLPFWEASA